MNNPLRHVVTDEGEASPRAALNFSFFTHAMR